MVKSKGFWKENKMLFLGIGLGVMLIAGFMVGIRMSIDTSVVNKLQQYTQSVRTNDMFNPIEITNNAGIITVEITLANLNRIGTVDFSDIYIHLYRIENPIVTVYDWDTRGQFIDDILLDGQDYEDYCDNPDPTNTYWTHFYIDWATGHTISEGFTYAILVDFYDGDDIMHYCEQVWNYVSWGGGVGPIPSSSLNIVTGTPPPETDMEDIINNCDYISFFELVSSSDEITPTITPTTPVESKPASGWMNEYSIFASMQNWVFLMFLILLFGLIGLIVFLFIYFKKKKK